MLNIISLEINKNKITTIDRIAPKSDETCSNSESLEFKFLFMYRAIIGEEMLLITTKGNAVTKEILKAIWNCAVMWVAYENKIKEGNQITRKSNKFVSIMLKELVK